jgi:hypothetical protein
MSGEMIQTVIVSWDTPYTREAWESLQRKAASSNTQEGMELLSLGPALPDEEDERIALLFAHIHHGGDDGKVPQELHWTLNVRPRPKSEPPDQVKKDNETLGGRPGLMNLLDQSITGVPPVASFQLTSVVSNEYQCKVLPRSVVARGGEHNIAASLARTTRLEQIGYRFEDSPYGLEEVAIVYAHREDHFIVTIRARIPLRIGTKRWLPPADDMRDIVLKAFFEKGQSGHDS